jgi:hypothetical protein
MKYDRKTARFRDEKGRFVTTETVRSQIEKVVDLVGRRNRDLTKRLNAGEIDLPSWKKQMRLNIKTLHTLSASVGRGGRRQMTKSDWGKVGSEIKKQYAYLDKFETAIKKRQISPLQAEFRATLYARSARTVFAQTEKVSNREAGKTLSRRVLHSSETCAECRDWASRGFVEDQPALGSLICKSNCRCSIEYA